MNITVTINPKLMELMTKLQNDIEGGMTAGMINLLAELEAHAVKETPVNTSELVNSITSYVTDGGRGGVLKATARHASFVHSGTGIYGPSGQPIVILPVHAKALYWPGAAHPVKKVVQKGIKPNPYFERAIGKSKPQSSFEEGIANYLAAGGW